MAVKGLFVIGFEEAEVLQILANAKALIVEGKTIMNYGEGTTNVSKQFTLPVEDVILECQYALEIFRPEVYAVASHRYLKSNFRGFHQH